MKRWVSQVPLMSLYCHLIIYLFLPISRKTVALGTGLAVSTICLAMFIVIELTYVRTIHCFLQLPLTIPIVIPVNLCFKAKLFQDGRKVTCF